MKHRSNRKKLNYPKRSKLEILPNNTSEAHNCVSDDIYKAKLQAAFTFHQQGDLSQAESLYKEILRTQPAHFSALQLLASLTLQNKYFIEAAVLFEKALKINPNHFISLINYAVALKELNRHEDAMTYYDKAIAINPDYTHLYYNRGIALKELKRYEEALESYDKAISLKSGYAEAYHNRANVLTELKRYEEALESYDKAISIRSDYFEAYYNRGITLLELKRYNEAVVSLDQVIVLKSDYASAFYNRGNVLHLLKRSHEALQSYDTAIALNPHYAEVFFNYGNVLYELQRFDEALVCYDKAITLKVDYAEAYSNRGNMLQVLKRYDEAMVCYDKAIHLNHNYADPYFNRGNLLQLLDRSEEALASYEAAITLKAEYAEAYTNRGNVLHELKRFDEALSSFDKAIALKPDYAEAYSNRGNVLQEFKRYNEALESNEKAIALKADYVEGYTNRGNVLHELKRSEDALANYDRAIALKPDYAEAYSNRGTLLQELKRYDEALVSYDQAIVLNPDLAYLLGTCCSAKMTVCDWSNIKHYVGQLVEKIERHEKAITPFPLLALVDAVSLQKEAALIYVEEKCPSSHLLPEISKHARHDKIRIGYFSADFRSHAVARLTAELYETHDRSRFEITAFSFGPNTNDEMRKRIEAAFDHFLDVQNLSEIEIAKLSRNMAIDIAVDLGGFTALCRNDIFALRSAPIQVNYLGYPGTMGTDYHDYIITDPIIIPEGSQQYYTEKMVYLPNSYQVNDTKCQIADKVFSREELGLPKDGFVFCCFNNSYKITPDSFDGWMRILMQVEGSVLWLLEDNPMVVCNLRKEAVQRGVNAERLIFAMRMPLPLHLSRHRSADLFLDTLPYNAHTTASDALWAGLPLLTCTGESFASRVATSLLNAIHLPELITLTQEKYESLAIELATTPAKLQEIRQKLQRNRLMTPLFDTIMFTRDIEEAYKSIYERYQGDLPPDHIFVKPY